MDLEAHEIFRPKRDGIHKLVKTFQYVSKLVVWHTESANPNVAHRTKQWEVAAGLSRKDFRSGRFLTGFNTLRRSAGSTLTFRLLAELANAGEMVYFFFDHFLWLSRIGVLDAHLARKMSFISAFGESFDYIFFVISEFIIIGEGIKEEHKLRHSTENPKDVTESIGKIRVDRVMRLMAVAANLIIGVADIEPNPFCNHAVTLGIGLCMGRLVYVEIGPREVYPQANLSEMDNCSTVVLCEEGLDNVIQDTRKISCSFGSNQSH
ncbi:hypothetical protein RJ639_021137 [Escallonia herrerae]|uniref:Peroxisomal membrane protein 11B n=1 Tax=Escallonia herrerae TaxID=1293975 RepID=A0AA88V528_9ASTE|nr:hypothetical protein RJ639_021137 [Escallonia herrerae]